MIRYFIDTEFIEFPGCLEPISIGIRCEDGREFYAINADADFSRADDWINKNVIAKLPLRDDLRWMTREALALALKAFVIGEPEFWAYFAAYDFVVFCWLLGGRMVELPAGWPKHCMDLKQSMVELGYRKNDLPPKPADAHDALADACWLEQAWLVVMGSKGGHVLYGRQNSNS